MDIRLHRPQSVCSRTGRTFTAGDVFVSALVRENGGLSRVDVSPDAWVEPPAGTIAWWRSRYPAPGEAGPSLAPVDVLLDALESLEGDPESQPLRYLLALQLVRRRVLKIQDQHDEASRDGSLTLACRRRDREYRVPPITSDQVTDPAVAAKLDALLWSGEAA
jgi:hypothetical protein